MINVLSSKNLFSKYGYTIPLFIVICYMIILYIDIVTAQYRWDIATSNEWQILIIPITIYMIWFRKAEWLSKGIKPSRVIGLPTLLIGLVFYIWGIVDLRDSITELSILFTVFGFSFLFLGIKSTNVLAVPYFYILCGTSLFITFSSIFQKVITPFLQLASANTAVLILKSIGLHIVQNGTYFRLPSGTLDVAAECSGYNQLFTLVALSVPLAYCALNRWLFRAIIILLSFPIAILMNSVRIALIGIWNYNLMKDDVHGPYSILYAPFIFMVGLLLLYFIVNKLKKYDSITNLYDVSNIPIKLPIRSTTIFILFAIILKIFLLKNSSKPDIIVLPSVIGNWHQSENYQRYPQSIFTKAMALKPFDYFNLKLYIYNEIPVYLAQAQINNQLPGKSYKSFYLPEGKEGITTLKIPENGNFSTKYKIFSSSTGDTGILYQFYYYSQQFKSTPEIHASFFRKFINGSGGITIFNIYFPGQYDKSLTDTIAEHLLFSLFGLTGNKML